MAKIVKRTKKDGSCSYCIRVSNGYDRAGRQVLVNRTYTPPPGMTGKKLEKELEAEEEKVKNQDLSLVHESVTEEEIARIISRWTGIPVAKLTESERN